MRKLLLTITLFAFTFAHAQNSTEAKFAYQMAEEQFEAKQYVEALEFLDKSEKALGSINPPMAFLKVMITDQIAATFDKDFSGKESSGKQAFANLEKAISDFEKVKGKEALGEDKLMDVYRIKMNFDKRKTAFEAEVNKTESLRKDYFAMMNKIAKEFPKTETTVSHFISNLPKSWEEPLFANHDKFNEKRFNKVVQWGEMHRSYPNFFKVDEGAGLFFLKTHNKGEDRIKEYQVLQLLKNKQRKYREGGRVLTVDEICGFLNITREMWEKLLHGEFITEFENNYFTRATKSEKGVDGENKEISIGIMKMTMFTGYKDDNKECLRIVIFKNTY